MKIDSVGLIVRSEKFRKKFFQGSNQKKKIFFRKFILNPNMRWEVPLRKWWNGNRFITSRTLPSRPWPWPTQKVTSRHDKQLSRPGFYCFPKSSFSRFWSIFETKIFWKNFQGRTKKKNFFRKLDETQICVERCH